MSDVLIEKLRIACDQLNENQDKAAFDNLGSAIDALIQQSGKVSDERAQQIARNDLDAFISPKTMRAALEAAQLPARPVVKWQLIASAPQDGSRVICWNSLWVAPESGCRYGPFWAANGLAADKGGWKHQPTHWQPLPDTPCLPALEGEDTPPLPTKSLGRFAEDDFFTGDSDE